jgi:hypothetical protein
LKGVPPNRQEGQAIFMPQINAIEIPTNIPSQRTMADTTNRKGIGNLRRKK